MKRFKQYLIEEMATDKVAPEATNTTPQSSVTPPAPAMFAPDSVKQQYAKTVAQQDPNLQPGNNEEVSEEEVDPPPPSLEEWMRENPMPRPEDYESEDGYNDAWQYWREQYEEWLDDWKEYRWRQLQPPDRWYDWNPNSNEPWTPGQWEREFDEWWERRYPEDRDPNKPTREEYEYWREIFEKLMRQAGETNPSHPYWRELFDWLFRYHQWQRNGGQGDPPQPPTP